MKRLSAAGLVLVLALAGCGGAVERAKPKPPRLPRDLAQSWAQQADQVGAALSAGDGCTAKQLAVSLRGQFISAVNDHRVPRRLQEPLGSAFNDLQSRTVCVPVTVRSGKQWNGHGGHGGHGDHGGKNGNGNGDGGGD
jgi:hypothetical protein